MNLGEEESRNGYSHFHNIDWFRIIWVVNWKKVTKDRGNKASDPQYFTIFFNYTVFSSIQIQIESANQTTIPSRMSDMQGFNVKTVFVPICG